VADTQRALVLGAGGFIGAALCRSLLAAGHAVVGFGRGPRPPSLPVAVDWRQGEFADAGAVAAALAGCSLVYHLIGSASPGVDAADDIRSAVLPTLTLLDLAAATGVRRLVFVSSGGAIYGVRRQTPIREDDPTEPISAYGVNKLTIEKYLHLYHHRHGLDYCALRVANPFGEHQTAHRQQGVIAAFFAAAMAGRPLVIWGDGTAVRDYVYIGDVVDALMRAGAAERLTRRVLNIGGGAGRSVNEVAAAVEQAVGRPLAREYRPSRPVDVPAVVLDVTQAAEALGWAPRALWEDALRRTCAWHQETV
jgi:UDP-glucose 4-epimerase